MPAAGAELEVVAFEAFAADAYKNRCGA